MSNPVRNINFYASMAEVTARLEELKVEGKELEHTRKLTQQAALPAFDARIQAIEEEINYLASQICFLKKS